MTYKVIEYDVTDVKVVSPFGFNVNMYNANSEFEVKQFLNAIAKRRKIDLSTDEGMEELNGIIDIDIVQDEMLPEDIFYNE